MTGSRPTAWLALLLALGLLACGPPRNQVLVVLGAASLSRALADVGAAFESRAERPVRFSFAGSQTLATQVREGIGADVIAVADTALLDELLAAGLVSPPREFAGNRLVWIAAITGHRPRLTPADLRQRGRLVLAAPSVPAGRYAREALGRLGLGDVTERRLVSVELDVRGVLTKVALAAADAGVVYQTDVRRTDRASVHVELLPDAAQPRIRYGAAALSDSRQPEVAAAFVGFLVAPEGQELLRQHGFASP